jgi:Cu-Zn family superoxide dismutase
MRAIRLAGRLLVFGAAATLLGAGPSCADDENDSFSHDRTLAKATLQSCDPTVTVSGTAFFTEVPSSEGVKVVDVTLFVRGLKPGKHAVHVHETGSCDNTVNSAGVVVPCGGAGSHLDPGPAGSNTPVEANHPHHSGDLINVAVGSRGEGFMHTVTSRIALSPGKLSVFDANGSAIVIHVAEDTYCPSDPSAAGCAGGGRAACGILKLVQ